MISLGIFGDTATEHFAAGQVIFREGDPIGDGKMYVVAEGELTILVGSRVVENPSTGSIFGEMALIDSRPRSATVIAKTDCELAAIDKPRFEFLVQKHPYFALEVMWVMAERLRKMDKLLSSQNFPV
jgi:CRP/FNR family cyclic AMP-dependent transcriptional regulator